MNTKHASGEVTCEHRKPGALAVATGSALRTPTDTAGLVMRLRALADDRFSGDVIESWLLDAADEIERLSSLMRPWMLGESCDLRAENDRLRSAYQDEHSRRLRLQQAFDDQPNNPVTDAEPSTPANTRAQGPRSV